jgi:hypothetical protein
MGRYLDMAEQALAKQAKEAKKGQSRGSAAPKVDREVPDPCSECGSRAWVVSLVAADLSRACYDCLIGATALRRTGVPF